MNINYSALCIIPARGGSKRIPGKNIKKLAGKPLLAYTIQAVAESGCFDDVYVSSDDREILSVAQQFGVKKDERSPELSGDTVKAVDVIAEFLSRKENHGKWDTVAMCLPTCPFRTKEDVIDAMQLFNKEKQNCPRLIGITRSDFPPQLALKRMSDENNTVDMREPEAYGFSTRSQDIEPLFYPNGSIYISTVSAFLETGTFFGRPMLAYEMPAERSFDIDYQYQFDISEYMMQSILMASQKV